MKKFLVIFLVLGFSIFASENLINFTVSKSLENGKTVKIIPLEKGGQAFKLDFSGFDANEKLKITSTSGEEVGNFEVPTSEKGDALTIIAPAVADKEGGKANILIKTSSEEEISLDYYWGKDLSLNETKSE